MATMTTTLNERIFQKLEHVLGDLDKLPEYQKLKASSFMDLNVDKLSGDGEEIRIALSHYFKQGGDMIPDPDMEMMVFPDLEMVEPLTYQDSYVYREVFPDSGGIDLKARKDLSVFLNQWLSNIIDEGYMKVGGNGHAV